MTEAVLCQYPADLPVCCDNFLQMEVNECLEPATYRMLGLVRLPLPERIDIEGGYILSWTLPHDEDITALKKIVALLKNSVVPMNIYDPPKLERGYPPIWNVTEYAGDTKYRRSVIIGVDVDDANTPDCTAILATFKTLPEGHE